MSRNKRGSGAAEMAYTHFFGNGPINYNPARNRESAIESMLQRSIMNLAANRFKWEGLPESIDVRFLEMNLMFTALTVFYYDTEYEKYLAVKGNGAGFVNMIDNPISFTVIGPGVNMSATGDNAMASFFNKTLSAFDPTRHLGDAISDEERKLKCVPIWANYMRTPDMDLIKIYASRLAWLDRTLEINTKNARRNKVLKGTENTQLSTLNFARQLDAGEDGLLVTGAMQDLEFIEALDLSVNPDSYDKLSILRTRVWNECMGLLGIDNANQDKKERLVAAEVGANDSQTDSIRYVNLNARQEACEHINQAFGLNVSVNFRTEAEAEEKQEQAMAQARQAGSNAVNPNGEDRNSDEDEED